MNYLFLDFDGVICDSVAETYVTSWIGYWSLRGRQPDSVSLAEKETYYSIRPFIRDAEDYFVLHYSLEHDIPLIDQASFDDLAESLGKETLETYTKTFYEVRKRLMRDDLAYWISLHRLFPAMKPVFGRLAQDRRVHILSTKRAHFISFILKNLGFHWPEERIHYGRGKEKLELLRNFLGPSRRNSAVFIEDQIDNVKRNRDLRITPYIASWGYIHPEWVKQQEVPLIDEKQFSGLVQKYILQLENLVDR